MIKGTVAALMIAVSAAQFDFDQFTRQGRNNRGRNSRNNDLFNQFNPEKMMKGNGLQNMMKQGKGL